MNKQITIKTSYEGKIKRFESPDSFRELLSIIRESYNINSQVYVTINYKDTQNNEQIISTDFQYKGAIHYGFQHEMEILRLTVSTKIIINDYTLLQNNLQGELFMENKLKNDSLITQAIEPNSIDEIEDFFNNPKIMIHESKYPQCNLENEFNSIRVSKKLPNSFKEGNMITENYDNNSDLREIIIKEITTQCNSFKEHLTAKCLHLLQTTSINNKISSKNINPKSLHKGFFCHICNMNPIMGFKFTCTVCEDIHYCDNCEEASYCSENHSLLKLKYPKHEEINLPDSLKFNNYTIDEEEEIPSYSQIIYDLNAHFTNNNIEVETNEMFRAECEVIVTNKGNKPWSKYTKSFVCIEGNKLQGKSFPIDTLVSVGKDYKIKFSLNTKNMPKGEYPTKWRMKDKFGDFFGPTLDILILVNHIKPKRSLCKSNIMECISCSRKFIEKSFYIHSRVCKRIFGKPREIFNSKNTRIIDGEHLQIIKLMKRYKKPSKDELERPKKTNWKKQSNELRQLIKVARKNKICFFRPSQQL